MTVLVWGDATPEIHSGLDRALIDHPNHGVVSWSGLVALSESTLKEVSLSSEFNGRSYANLRFGGFYQAAISAYDFPETVVEILGMVEIVPGFFITRQQRETFNLSYRTLVGEDNYLIHFVYNAVLTPIKAKYQTSGKESKPILSEWRIDALPPALNGGKPTSHLVVDSRLTDPTVLETIENTLYGTDITDPEFPTQMELVTIFAS